MLIDASSDDISNGKAYSNYMNYIDAIKLKLPENVLKFATDGRKYTSEDPLHDSWVEDIIVHEVSSGTRREKRTQEVTIRLLSAYHDKYLIIHYVSVQKFQLIASDLKHGFGDWLLDEIAHDGSHPVHTISFSSGSRLEIVFEDIEIIEQPLLTT